ncbi:MAG: hypothetical protein U5J83_19030 [Bryobacterales bacterium]|nr:hypothetical protein [Bryobacterales bacterium]
MKKTTDFRILSAAAALASLLGFSMLAAAASAEIPLKRAKDWGSARGWGHVTLRLRVTGEAVVGVRGARVSVDTAQGQSVTNLGSDCSEPLPQRQVPVVVNVPLGRGRVTVSQKPSAANRYAMVLRVSDPQPGAGPYEIQIRFGDVDEAPGSTNYDPHANWQGSGFRRPQSWLGLPGKPLSEQGRQNLSASSAGKSLFVFNGYVDDDTILCLRGNHVSTAAPSRRLPKIRSWGLSRAMPVTRRPRNLRVSGTPRGVRILEYPSYRNEYTTVLFIPKASRAVLAGIRLQWE